MEWVGNNESEIYAYACGANFHSHTNRNALLHNLPPIFKNEFGREQGKEVLNTLTHKHNALLHNSPTIFENG